MKRRKILLILGSALALLLGLLAGLWGFLWLDPRPTLRLRDGSTLSVQGAWPDRPQPVVMGPRWMQVLFGFTPPTTRDQLGWRMSYPAGWRNTALCLSVMHRSSSPRRVDFVLEDSHGCRFHPADVDIDGFGVDHFLTTLQYPFAPTDDPYYQLHLLDDTTVPNSLSGEVLPLLNPSRRRSVEWLPDGPLPLTRRDRDLQATLRSVSAGRSFAQPTRPVGGADPPALVMDMDLTGDWRPVSVTVSDASGSSFQQSCSSSGVNACRVWLPVSLCRKRRAYKVRVEFTRAFTSGAAPDARSRVRSVSLTPGPGSRAIPLQGGLSLTTSAGRTLNNEAVLGGTLALPREGWRFRVYPSRPRGGFDLAEPAPSSSLSQWFQFQFPAGTKTADLVIEGFRSRFLEWKVKPVWPDEEAATTRPAAAR